MNNHSKDDGARARERALIERERKFLGRVAEELHGWHASEDGPVVVYPAEEGDLETGSVLGFVVHSDGSFTLGESMNRTFWRKK